MEIKNPRGSVDELSLVKAAAWAWYQHGSGSDVKPKPEFDLTRFKNVPKPSRYKLQAIKQVEETADSSCSSSVSNNSLLDKYEIERISKQLDLYIESSHAQHYSGFYAAGDSAEKGTAVAVEQSGGWIGMKSEQKKKMKEISKGYFWFRHSLLCGSTHDVVKSRSFGHIGRLHRQEKHTV